jgi:hypothetical protein
VNFAKQEELGKKVRVWKQREGAINKKKGSGEKFFDPVLHISQPQPAKEISFPKWFKHSCFLVLDIKC